jgi:hypothetical protein
MSISDSTLNPNPNRTAGAWRWLRWLALGLLLIAALAAIGLWALSHYIDRERIVILVAAEVKKATGRDMHVDGPIGFHLRPALAVQISGVRLSNSAWGTKPDMLKARHLELDVALRPLLDKRLEIRRVLLEGVEIWLETDPQGMGNWVMHGEARPPAPVNPSADASKPLVIDLAQLDVLDSTVSVHAGRSGRTEVLTLERLTLRNAGSDDQLDAQLRFREQAVAIKGSMGKLAALTGAADRFPFDLSLTLEGGRFSAKGEVGIGSRIGVANVDVEGAVQQTAALSALAGPALALPASMPLPLQFSGRVEQTREAISLPTFKLALGGQAVSGQLRYAVGDEKAAPRPRLTGAISSDMLDLGALVGKPATASTAAARPGKATRLFSDVALPLPALPALDVQLELSVAQLRLPGQTAGQALTALHAVIRLQGDTIEARPVAFKLADGTVSGAATLRLPQGGGVPSYGVQMQASGVGLDHALSLSGSTHGVRGGRSDLRIDLRADGASPHQLARSLNGDLRLSVGPAHIDGDLAGLGGDVATRLVEAVNPLHKQNKGSDLQCAAVLLPIRGGHIVIDHSIAMESDQLDVVASGEIDLGAETLAVVVRPAVKQGLGVGAANLAQLVKLRGSLSQPVIAADLQGATREAASIGAAVATGGLSLIGERMLKEKRDPHPCVTALGGGGRSGEAEPKQSAVKAVGKAAGKLSSGVSGLMRGRGSK